MARKDSVRRFAFFVGILVAAAALVAVLTGPRTGSNSCSCPFVPAPPLEPTAPKQPTEASPRPATAPPPRPALIRKASLAGAKVHESSGIAPSRLRDGLWWTHNDSGGRARIFAFDAAGKDLGVVTIENARHVDWEDMASFVRDGRAYLLLADVGDNNRVRQDCRLYIVAEPVLADSKMPSSVTAEMTIAFTYDHGPLNCEAVAVDAAAAEVYLIAKTRGRAAGVYCLPLPETQPSEPLIARRIATVPIARVTGMDFSADVTRAAVCTYVDGYEFIRPSGGTWREAFEAPPRRVSLPLRCQGEAIAYARDGKTLMVTSEGAPMPIWILQVDVQKPAFKIAR